MEIQPIENFVFDGILKRFTQVFGCPAILTTVNDKSRTLDKFSEGRGVEYPYAFLTVQSIAVDATRYANRRIMRRGLTVAAGQDQSFQARLVPTNFVIEVEYWTNEFIGKGTKPVLSFARRWMFAQQTGMLKFNVEYGRLPVLIGITMDESVPTPPLENRAEQESAYKIVGSLTVHGWVSEPVLGSQGVINNIQAEIALAADGSVEGYVFEPFN